MANIEKIELNTKSIAEELKQVKNLTESERVTKSEALKSQLKSMNDELHAHLSTLDSKTDAQSTNERAKTEELLGQMNTMNDELLTLGADVKETQEPVDDAGWFEKKREYIKNNPLHAAGIAGAATLAFEGIKSARNSLTGWFSGSPKPKKEGGRRKSILKSLGVAGGVGLAALGLPKVRDKLKERMPDLFGPELNFEDSFSKVQTDLHAISEKQVSIGADMTREDLGEGKVLLKSYTQSVEIDTKNKTLPGLDTKFSSFTELIHAANLANFCKGAFRGRCEHNEPFDETKFGGDLQVDLAEGGKEEFISGAGIPVGKILGGLIPAGLMLFTPAGKGVSKTIGIQGGIAAILAGIAIGHFAGDTNSTLQKICPQIADGVGRDQFLQYLNRMKIRQKGSGSEDEVKESPIKQEILAIRDKIKATKAIESNGNHRNLNAEIDKNNPNKIIITSYGKEKINVFYNHDPKSLQIEGNFTTRFTNIEEGIRAANLTNHFKNTYGGKCKREDPFTYGRDIKGKGIYVDNDRLDDQALTEDSLEKHTPTLFANKDAYIKFLNEMKDDGKSLWKA